MFGKTQQLRGQLADGLPAQLGDRLGSVSEPARAARLHLGALPLDPRTLLLGK
jgi:hypothetical protein